MERGNIMPISQKHKDERDAFVADGKMVPTVGLVHRGYGLHYLPFFDLTLAGKISVQPLLTAIHEDEAGR